MTVEFSKDSYKTTETISYEVDLGNSYFAEKLIHNVAGENYNSLYASNIETEGDIKEAADEYKIKIKTRSASTFAFTYDGTTYTAELVNRSRNNISNYEITVSNGQETCKFNSKIYYDDAITSDICNAKNSKNFNYSTSYDDNDNVIYTVNYFKKDNENEFNNCMDILTSHKTDNCDDDDDCDDDDYSNAKSSSSSYRSSSSNERIVLETKFDETAQTMVFLSTSTIPYCVTDESHSTFKMTSVTDSSSEYQAAKYEFSNDSLFIYECDYYEYYGFSDCDYYADIFVGGKAGSIFGTWKYTGCEKSGSYIDCYENEIGTINITKDGITATVELTDDEELIELDTTKFMDYLIYYITGYNGYDGYAPYANFLFSSGNLSIAALVHKVEVQSRADSEITLAYNNHEITTKLNKSQKYPTDVSVTVSSGDIKCELREIDYDYVTMNEETCKASNKEYFDYDYSYDSDNKAFYYVYEYSYSNRTEFETCMKDLFNTIHDIAETPVDTGDTDTGDTDVDTGDKDTDVDTGDTDTGDTDIDTGNSDTGDTDVDTGDKEVDIGGEAVVDVVPDAEMVAPAPSAFKKAYKQAERKKTSKFMRALMRANKR